MKFKDSEIPEYLSKIREQLQNDETFLLYLKMINETVRVIFHEQLQIDKTQDLKMYIIEFAMYLNNQIKNVENTNEEPNKIVEVKPKDKKGSNKSVGDIVQDIMKNLNNEDND